MCIVVFKQKTAYEVRISDWSSDVCSSDLKSQSWIGLCGRLVAEIPPTIDQLDHFGLAIERVRIDCAFVLAEKPDDRGDVRRDRRIDAEETGEREMSTILAVPPRKAEVRAAPPLHGVRTEIGHAPCGESMCQYVETSVA